MYVEKGSAFAIRKIQPIEKIDLGEERDFCRLTKGTCKEVGILV